MEEWWKTIEGFSNYEVSNYGYVRRKGKDKYMSPHKAKGGTLFVNLSRHGLAHSKSIKVLVAEAFVPREPNQDPEIFDTPIQCSISTDNVRADNLKWRPLWFALKFRRQLNDTPYYCAIPVVNLSTGDEHASILTAALHEGVLMQDIYRSALEGRKVPPTGHIYEFIREEV
jgi:NUMOD4 motif